VGRQIHFYMLPEDQNAFLQSARERDPVEVVFRDGSSAKVQPIAVFDANKTETLCLWNRTLAPRLRRKWIHDSGYYRIHESEESVLEFRPSLITAWERKPAIIQGRIYGVFDGHHGKSPEFEKWFDSLVRWIRNNFRKSPTRMGGYLGPAAQVFYEKGGYLLPQFLPPSTKEWRAELAEQHSR
jgi:hypothetical protein